MSLPGSPDQRLKTPESKAASSESVDLINEDFVSTARYSSSTLHQVVHDWLRLKDMIYVNDKPFSQLVDDVRQANLLKALQAFREKGPGELKDRLVLLRALYNTLNKHLSDYVHKTRYSDNPDEKKQRDSIVTMFQSVPGDSVAIDFNDNKMLAATATLFYAGLKKSGFEVSHLGELSSMPGLAALEKSIAKAGTYFLAESKDSDEILVALWRQHLLSDIPAEKDKLAYIDVLSRFAHQGAFFYSVLTQHSEYLSYEQSDGMPTYAINGVECLFSSTLRFNTKNNIIHVLEEVPIRRLTDNSRGVYIANQDDTPVINTVTEHRLSVRRNGSVDLSLVSAVDTVFNRQAMDIVLAAFHAHKKMLTDYADQYIAHGHDASAIPKIMRRYPKIEEKIPVKVQSFLERHAKFGQRMHHEGDRILAYIGMSFPRYADGVLSKIGQAPDLSEDSFVYAVKLLRRMNRYDLAIHVVMPYVLENEAASSTGMDMEKAREKAVRIVENEAEIRKVYPFVRDTFSRLRDEKQSGASPVKRV